MKDSTELNSHEKRRLDRELGELVRREKSDEMRDSTELSLRPLACRENSNELDRIVPRAICRVYHC